MDRTVDAASADLERLQEERSVEAGGPARMQPGFTARAEDNVSPLNLDVMTYDN